MSTQVMSACWKLQMPPTQKAVLISLADNANDAGECWPSIPTICERTCFGRTAVIEAVHWLESRHYLSADRSNGRKTRYWLTPSLGACDGVKPVRHTDRSATQTGSPNGLNQSASRTKPVRQTDPNHKEPSRTVSKKQRPAPAAPLVFDPPSWINREAWDGFAEMRRKIRKPMTMRAAELIVMALDRMRLDGHNPNTALDASTRNGWQDVYPPKPTNGQTRQQGPTSKTGTAIMALQDKINDLRSRTVVSDSPDAGHPTLALPEP